MDFMSSRPSDKEKCAASGVDAWNSLDAFSNFAPPMHCWSENEATESREEGFADRDAGFHFIPLGKKTASDAPADQVMPNASSL